MVNVLQETLYHSMPEDEASYLHSPTSPPGSKGRVAHGTAT